jgi:hypothetical protein
MTGRRICQLMVLSGCNATQIQKRGEAIRQAIAARVFNIDDAKLWVTISMGLLTIDRWDNAVSIESLLDRVDAALYRAKSEGRNRFVFADPPLPRCNAMQLAMRSRVLPLLIPSLYTCDVEAAVDEGDFAGDAAGER